MKRKDDSGAGLTIHRVICYLVLIFFTLLALFPFYVLIVNATRAHADIQKGFSAFFGGSVVSNFKAVLRDDAHPLVRAMLNSFIIAASSSALTVYFSAFTAYGINTYKDFKFRKFANGFILLIMMVPTQVSALGFIDLMVQFGLTNTFWPLIIPSIAAPAVYYFMLSYMESSLPMEIVEAARIDGANEFKTFNTIIIPMLKPALAVQAIFAFVQSWNNYFIPQLIIDSKNNKTLPILIAELRSADFTKFNMGQLYMSIAFAIVPVVIVYLILSKQIVRGVTLGGVKG